MDSRSSIRQKIDQRFNVGDVAREDRLREFDCDGHEVGIDHICGGRPGEQRADRSSVIERVNVDCCEESRQTCLPAAVTPDLRDNRVRGVERSASLERCVKELLRRTFAAVDGHQKPGIKNHSS